jgi:hypothetical protein
MCNNWQLLTAQIIAGPLPLGGGFFVFKRGPLTLRCLFISTSSHYHITTPANYRLYQNKTPGVSLPNRIIFFHFVTH